MPAIKPLAEFNRSQNAVIEELASTREPIYLTRNGQASVVVMDAAAFDEAMSFRETIRAHEMQTYSLLMKGYQDVLEGAVHPADEVAARIRAKKGWS